MHTNVIIADQPDGTFVLRTSRGMPVGGRLITVAPEQGRVLPCVPEEPFKTKNDAARAALAWNVYLDHAWRKRSKSKVRIAD